MKDIGVRIAVFLATFGLAILGAKAQTNVTTTGGTVGTVPIFTGPSTIGNSPIFQLGASTSIGAMNERLGTKFQVLTDSTTPAQPGQTEPGVVASQHHVDEALPKNEVPLAVVGIVPCKVTAENGPIAAGDLLVTSSTPGHAMKGTDRGRMLGAVVGKALEPMQKGTSMIRACQGKNTSPCT